MRIPLGIVESIQDFMETDKAFKMGLDSRADIVTVAVRDFLIKHGFFETNKILDECEDE